MPQLFQGLAMPLLRAMSLVLLCTGLSSLALECTDPTSVDTGTPRMRSLRSLLQDCRKLGSNRRWKLPAPLSSIRTHAGGMLFGRIQGDGRTPNQISAPPNHTVHILVGNRLRLSKANRLSGASTGVHHIAQMPDATY